MPAYSLVISNGSGSATFDGPATRVQPRFEPLFDNEHNASLSPAQLSATLETWHLRDFAYVAGSTPTDNVGDLNTLEAFLNSRSAPITSIVLKYNGVAQRTMDTTGYAQLMVRQLAAKSGPGSFATHWSGDLVVIGRKLRPDGAGIVKLEQRLTQTANDRGLVTQVWSGRIEVAPGTVIATALTSYVPASLGSHYVLETNNAGGYDLDIQNPPTNTVATFRQVQRDQGIMIPANATSFLERTQTRDTAGGRLMATTAEAGSTTQAAALAAAQSIKPSTGVAVIEQRQALNELTVEVVYTQRLPVPRVVALYGVGSLIDVRRTVTISGGGQARLFRPIPGFKPFELLGAQGTLVVREHVIVRATRVTGPGDIPLPALILPAALLQNPGCSEVAPYRDETAEGRDADLWVREATRVYETADPTSIDFATLFKSLYEAPKFSGDADYSTRISAGRGS